MIEFEKIKDESNIQEVIKSAFGVDLNIDGGWGYDTNSAIVVKSLEMPKKQFIQLFATIRATIQMNLLLDEESRCTGINPKRLETKNQSVNNKNYEKVIFEISAMNEKKYASFIQEYKKGYGNSDFDLENHFKRRKEDTIIINEDFWFEFK